MATAAFMNCSHVVNGNNVAELSNNNNVNEPEGIVIPLHTHTITCETLFFSTEIMMASVNSTLLVTADKNALKYAFAQISNLTSPDTGHHITYTHWYSTFYNISMAMDSYIPVDTYPNMTEKYESSKAAINQAIADGTFYSDLQAAAVLKGSTVFATMISVEGEVDPTYTYKYPPTIAPTMAPTAAPTGEDVIVSSHKDNRNTLKKVTKGEIAAIVIMSVVGFGILIAILYFGINAARGGNAANAPKEVATTEKTPASNANYQTVDTSDVQVVTIAEVDEKV